MTELVELRERVTQLEALVDDVHDLARSTDQEVSGWRGALNNHTKTLNAIRKDQNEHGQKLARFAAELAEVRSDMDRSFAEVRSDMDRSFAEVRSDMDRSFAEARSDMDRGFAEVRSEMGRGFGLLANGQALITNLLNRHLDEPDEETSAGGADE